MEAWEMWNTFFDRPMAINVLMEMTDSEDFADNLVLLILGLILLVFVLLFILHIAKGKRLGIRSVSLPKWKKENVLFAFSMVSLVISICSILFAGFVYAKFQSLYEFFSVFQ